LKIIFNFRSLFLLGLCASLAILGSAYFLEYGFNYIPCPLCLLQRYALWGILVLFGIGFLYPGKNLSRLFICSGLISFSVLGILLASRHLWLQHLPPGAIASCGADLERLLQFKPFLEVFKEVFMNAEECARIDFTFLGLSLSLWSLLAFIGFAVFSSLILILQIKRRI